MAPARTQPTAPPRIFPPVLGLEVPAVFDELFANAIVMLSNVKPLEGPDRVPRALLAGIPWGASTPGAIAAGCARYPSAAAVIDEHGSLTFRDLWRSSDELAWELLESGIGRDRRVGLLARNHRGFVQTLLAVAKTGADLVLLNPEFAAPQLVDVVVSERLDRVLHDRDCAAAAAACEVASCLDDRLAASARDARRSVRPPSRPGRMIILTSGTTGRPKGATHRGDGSAQGVAATVGRIPFRPGDIQVVAAPLFHGWGLTNLLLALARSSTTVLMRVFDAAQTLDTVSRQGADVLVVVPVMLQRILALGPQALVDADTTRLRVIASSGSALGGKLVGETLDRIGPVLYNVYGSTEVTVAAIATPFDLRRNAACAGSPVLGARVEVVDDQGKPVAPGSIGRVFVGTATRFEGYTNGGGKEERDGLLSSGDLGHFDPSGLLVIDGREDDMIVSGGENVYPAKVEELLTRHPGIAQVAVVGVPDPDFGQGLAAFVVAREGRELTVEDVKRHVHRNLARFKVPRRVEFLTELPRTTTGKVLKREFVQACLD